MSGQPTTRRRSSVHRPSIEFSKLGPMSVLVPKAGAAFNIVYIGAGNINFGGDQGPWDHSRRLEHKLGPRLKVTAIIDPNHATAEAVLVRKRGSFVVSAYENTRICSSFDEFVKTMKPEEKPHGFIVGSPPQFRGSIVTGRDIELMILKAFPNDTPAIFLEKPVSTDTVANAIPVGRALFDAKTVVSVGYFLRYLKVVQKMRAVIEDNDLHVMATVARYVCVYSTIDKPAWWMKSRDCGPIIEQATHFVDLSRYFGGDVDLTSVQAHSLEWYEEAGELSAIPVDESIIAEDDRIPRVTSATWKYETGAVGSLTHALVLQGHKFSTELEIYADGYQLRLLDPYNNPCLKVRHPQNDDEEVHVFPNDDPYFGEISAFIDACDPAAHNESAVANDDDVDILSTFEDSVKTFALTWAIREASEQSRKMGRSAAANKRSAKEAAARAAKASA